MVVVLIAGLVALLSIDYLARVAIETAGSRALGVNTSLDEISLGIFSDRSSLAGFQVANPAGFESSYFLRLDDGALNMSLFNVLEDTIEIDQLTLSGIHLNLVREKQQANYGTILANTRRFDDKNAQPEKSGLAAGKHFLIRSVVIRDVQVHLDLLPIGGKLTELDVPIELLELSDVGAESSRGENLAKIIATIVRALLEAVLAKGESILPPETQQELSDILSELKPLETLRDLRNSLQERREQRREDAELRREQAEPRRRPFAPFRQRRLDRQ